MGTKRPKPDVDMTYLKNQSIYESSHNTLRKKGVYKTDMHKIYNLTVGQ